ncbi:MAG: tetratricopeptide repeat protein, partial [Leptolyngbyaceae bacterium]|nr:tetratricopeptide repeat protein [Leptolyngbyaceae bacterium]
MTGGGQGLRRSRLWGMGWLLGGALLPFALPCRALEPDLPFPQIAQVIDYPLPVSDTRGSQWFQQGNQLFQSSQFGSALEAYGQALTVMETIEPTPDNLLLEGNILSNGAIAARILGQLDQAEIYVTEAIALARTLDNQDLLARSLNEAGVIAYSRSQFDLALGHYQQALEISRAIGNTQVEIHVLDNMGVVYRRRGAYDQALTLHQQALTVFEADGSLADPSIHARILNNIGIVWSLYGDYVKALDFNLRGLAIAQRENQPFVEGRILSSIGFTYGELGNYDQALNFLQRALTVTETLGNQAELGRVLNNLGTIALRQGDYAGAIAYLERSLSIQQAMSNDIDVAINFNNLGLAHWNLGEYDTALHYYQQALELQQDIGDRPGEAYSLASIGTVSFSTGDYTRSLEAFERSLQIFRNIGANNRVGDTLNSIGGIHYSLGQLETALDYYQQAAAMRRQVGDRPGLATTLNNLGLVYSQRDDNSAALAAFEQALAIRQQVGDRSGEASTLNSIAALANQLQHYDRAMDTAQQALSLYRTVGNPIGAANALTTLGTSYAALNQPQAALDAFQAALVTFQASCNREGERFILGSIGDSFAEQGETELAIVFYKQAVNLTEAIRQGLRPLASDVQQTYTDTVANTYRRLADLLLQGDRVLEAQRVLDLLKVQELDDYLQGMERSGGTESGIALRPEEQQLADQFQANQNQLVTLGLELEQLETIDPIERTPEQRDRLLELRQLQQTSRQAFRTFFEAEEIQTLVAQLRQTTGAASLELTELNALQDNLRSLTQTAVLFYPLVLEDRTELIVVTPNAPPIRRTTVVDRVALNRAIAQFRSALQAPHIASVAETQQLAQTLYNWLIRPVEADLAQAEAETILYAPDGQLRYIPLAALHDGEQWLVEHYQINNITAASLADLDNRPFQNQLTVLAAAFTQGQYRVQVGDRVFSFGGLTFAGQEVETLAQLIPATATRLDTEFNPNIVYEMNDFSVVHLATHATFNPGPPEESFILFGDGSRATLADIRDWNIPDVELVVLSAC